MSSQIGHQSTRSRVVTRFRQSFERLPRGGNGVSKYPSLRNAFDSSSCRFSRKDKVVDSLTGLTENWTSPEKPAKMVTPPRN